MDPCAKLTIGIDASRIHMGATGVGRYTQALLEPLDRAMPNTNFVLFAKRTHNITPPSERWTTICDTHVLWSRLPVTFWIHYRLGRLIRQKQINILWAANSFIPRAANSVPAVVTVFDLRHVLYSRDLPPVTRLAHKLWFRSSIGRAKVVVAISKGTSDRMQKIFGRCADVIAKPSVPPLPASGPDMVRRMLVGVGVRTPFLLTVGSSPCKNLPIVKSAVAWLKKRGQLHGHQLVMVGPRTGGGLAGGAAPHDRQWVKKLGRVSDDLLAALYASADALVFPSVYEGFGIPVLEARATGCRVITTDSPELREAGGTDAIYAVPTCEGVADGIQRALKLPRPRPVPTVALTWDEPGYAMAEAFRAAASSVR